ncbi:MAG: MFS transporter [Alphaproteobacteria bacterium]|nr:MFS transporter [Alphaproteobacteria bacterium]
MTPVDTNQSMKKVIISCMIGNALEWYDFVIYGYFSVIIGKLFFPSADPIAQLVATLGVFWVGFIARPLGAILFGHIGDKVSRKAALTISIYVMAIPTALIGCLPTYEYIGAWGGFLLMILRVFQGLAIGGEFTGSMVFMVEHAPAEKRGLAGSWATCSLVIGVIIGSAVATIFTTLLTQEQLELWGWRVPFILSIFGSLIGTYMRKNLSDPVAYIDAKRKRKAQSTPLKDLILCHKSKLLLVVLVDFLTAVGFFMLVIFLTTYFKTFLHLSDRRSLFINTVNMLVFCLVIPIGGWLSDKYGRRALLAYPCLGFMVLSYPLFGLIQHGSYGALMAQMIMVIMMGLFFGTIPATLSEIFPTQVRFSGLSVAHNISMAVFGGGIPLIATKLIHFTGDLASPAYLLIVAAALSLLSVPFLSGGKKEEFSELELSPAEAQDALA